jgi:hypothetical protein
MSPENSIYLPSDLLIYCAFLMVLFLREFQHLRERKKSPRQLALRMRLSLLVDLVYTVQAVEPIANAHTLLEQ